jgi:hypothetical protein
VSKFITRDNGKAGSGKNGVLRTSYDTTVVLSKTVVYINFAYFGCTEKENGYKKEIVMLRSSISIKVLWNK